ncbi:MAG TPA: dihydroorotate dehydrogenase-like protein [Tepidisphaeraceae bacterium]|nr:dihydroorotate dehydrogenase-like protein [Tepidisphaeraceae bacterium]
MDLSTNYMGLRLSNPLMPGASPLVDNLDAVKRLEDAGAAAIVMHSLFEEQITGEQLGTIYQMEMYSNSFAEAMSYFPNPKDFALGPEQYLEHVAKIKKTLSIPVIASLNGTTQGGWVEYSKQIAQAGADALELNIYHVATDPLETSTQLEQRLIDLVRDIRASISIPLAVKLSPFFSSLPNLCCRLDDVKVDGLVLFNRFYQPDIDLDLLEAVPKLALSDPSELLLRLRWLAILQPHVQASLACSGGVHSATDAIKAIMAGASAVQMVSALLLHGPSHLKNVLDEMKIWMEKNEYSSGRLMLGSMSLSRCPDAKAFERANYMRVLQSWRQQMNSPQTQA